MIARTLLVLLVFALLLAPASSQPQPAAPAASSKPLLPQPVAILAMVRSTLVAVDQANKTGNYTVLRDLAGPEFRDANDALKLSKVFAALSTQGVDLLAVTVATPQYKTPPQVTPKDMLYIYGSFAIAPRAINFEILYKMNGGRWRLFGVLIEPAPQNETPAATSPSPPAEAPQQ